MRNLAKYALKLAKYALKYAAYMLHICGITEICGVNDACTYVYVGQNVQKY